MKALSFVSQAIDDQVFSHEVEIGEDDILFCTIIRPHTVRFSWLVYGDINHGGYHWAQVFLSKENKELSIGREVVFNPEVVSKKIFKKETKTY